MFFFVDLGVYHRTKFHAIWTKIIFFLKFCKRRLRVKKVPKNAVFFLNTWNRFMYVLNHGLVI